MIDKIKGEVQYQDAINLMRKIGLQRMGFTTAWGYYDDPKRLVFTLSRYKFVAKMLEGKKNVVEVGCGDGFASRIVAQTVERLTVLDFDPDFVQCAKDIMSERWTFNVLEHDILDAPIPSLGDRAYDAAYSLDVMEHIPEDKETKYLQNICHSLDKNGVLIVGMPSKQSQVYASSHSRSGHVNCKDQKDLKKSLDSFFENVFTFSMNDEVVHTGYHQMANYNFALAVGKKV